MKACSGLALAMVFSVCARAQQPPAEIGELFAEDASGRLMQPAAAGMSVVSGSELTAGVTSARLRLTRGGQVRICPRSSMTVNSGRFGLMFAMSGGAIEIDYQLFQRGSDMIVTPDFNIQLAGPGKYHFALSADKQGDTCVKPLPGNAAPVQLSEVLGAASHRVNPQDATFFPEGKLSASAPLKPDQACGCPELPPVMQAAATPQASQQQPQPQSSSPTPVPITPAGNGTAEPLPADRPGQVHVEVEAPFVFSAKEGTGVTPYSVARLSLSGLPNVFFVQETVDPVVLPEKPAEVSVRQEPPVPGPPVTQKQPRQKKQKKGFFGKLKGLFGGIFGR